MSTRLASFLPAFFVIGFIALGILLIFGLTKEGKTSIFIADESGAEQKGIFRIYHHKVYADFAEKGVYYIPEANPAYLRLVANTPETESVYFQTTANTSFAQHIAADESHVYCGNLILPKLNPYNVYYIGDGYVSDGQLTYYCSLEFSPNQELGMIRAAYQQILFNFNKGPRPQTVLYSFKALPVAQVSYQLILPNIVTDGQQAYLAGELMPKALPQNLHYLLQPNKDKSSQHYLADGQHIYYDNNLLELQDNDQIIAYDISTAAGHYLEDSIQHNFYFKNKSFPNNLAPLRILNTTDKHGIPTLFHSPKGIYYIEGVKKVVKKAGKSPFKDKFEKIYPDVFSNGTSSFFLVANKTSTRGRNGYRLCSYITSLMELDNAPAEKWEEIGRAGYGAKSPGSIWRNGMHYYYFDNAGQESAIKSSIYKIRDPALANYMTFNAVESDTIYDYIQMGFLEIPPHREVIRAESRLHSRFRGC